jgi:hypothetical protein
MNDDDDDETARAVAVIENQLKSFKSPLLDINTKSKNRDSYSQRGQQMGYGDNDGAMGDPHYQMNAMEWYQQQLQEEPPTPAKTPKRTPLLERAGTPVMSNSSSKTLLALSKLASTPSGGRNTYGLIDDDDMDDDDDDKYTEPRPVETPMLQRRFKTISSSSSSSKFTTGGRRSISQGGFGTATTTTTTAMITSSLKKNNPSSASLKQYTFRKYHDALYDYLKAKHNINDRLDLEREERGLQQEGDNNDNMIMDMDYSFTSASLSQHECRTEVEYCKALCHIGYSLPMEDEASTEEGNFWSLLVSLRKLGLSALIWHDDSTSLTQNYSSQAFYLQQLTSKINSTPKELLESMIPSSSSSSSFSAQPPLVLQRKNELLKWIQSCLVLESKSIKGALPSSSAGNITTVQFSSHPDDSTIPSLISEMDGKILKTMIQVCLALILEGRTKEALDIARQRGQSWRAAAWIGGEPFGYTTEIKDETMSVDNIPVGNPNRFLWKRQVWNSGRRLLQKQQNQDTEIWNEEAAIYSILADDVTTALDNPCIRSSWTKSLCVLLMGMRGRTQDEVLHRHNINRRRNIGTRNGFPGYQYEKEENEQLMATANLSTMTEVQIASTLTNSHFLRQQEQQRREMINSSRRRRQFSSKSAIMAFVTGKSAILQLCAEETSQLVSDLKEVSLGNNDDDDYVNQDWEGVRFMTHLTLFLDSLQESSTPILLDGVSEQKDEILFEYVQYLESRPDLWHMLSLYVSLLPKSKIQEYYPNVLVKVLDDSERKLMTGQIRDLMPRLELPLLRKIVRLSLSAPSGSIGDESEEVMDKIKCNSLQWLLHQDDHMGDALICANILFRDLLLNEEEDKTYVAMTFMNDYLPESFLDLVRQTVSPIIEEEDENSNTVLNLGMERTVYAAKVDNAMTEYVAFNSYLEAYGTFEDWKQILQETPTALEDHQLPDATNLNETEKNIAKTNFLRSWVKEKKKHLEKTLHAAEEARLALHNVLTHPGGWLSADEDELANIHLADEEEQNRQRDIEKIRSRHLVLVVNLYHEVCEETASWLSRSLNDTENIHLPREEVLNLLQKSNSGNSTDADISPTPAFWYQHALDLATLVASDKNGISKAFSPSDLKDFISKLAETSICKLINV